MIKERDIQKSHNFRESVKKWGQPLRRHRIFNVTSSDHVTDRDVAFQYSSEGEGTENALKQAISDIDREIACKYREHEDLKSWIANRKAERQCLKNMGFNASWFQNKSKKTECEVRVFEKTKTNVGEKSEVVAIPDPSKYNRKPRLSEGHVNMLSFLDKPLPIALAMIADYLQDNRLRLVDLFSKADKNKDWCMSRTELKESLKHTTIPLKDAHLDELILALDVNDDDELSYRELAKGIEAYHKDKRWQRLKETYDDMIFKATNNDSDKLPSNEKKTEKLPQLDHRDHVNELFLNQHAKERQRKENEKKERQRVTKLQKTKVKRVQNEWQSTISGDIGEKKSQYMQLMNDECNRCVDLLHSEGIPVKSDTIRNVLMPPKDNSTRKCRRYLSSELSVHPINHPLICEYRKQQKQRLLKCHSSYVPSNPSSRDATGESRDGGRVPLPRVALLDFKNRQEKGRRARVERECAAPSPCWPQHLLDKLYLCMDDTGTKEQRKSVLFTMVPN